MTRYSSKTSKEIQNLSTDFLFSENTEMSNFMKIRPVRAKLFHAKERTDMTKLTDAFRNFCERS